MVKRPATTTFCPGVRTSSVLSSPPSSLDCCCCCLLLLLSPLLSVLNARSGVWQTAGRRDTNKAAADGVKVVVLQDEPPAATRLLGPRAVVAKPRRGRSSSCKDDDFFMAASMMVVVAVVVLRVSLVENIMGIDDDRLTTNSFVGLLVFVVGAAEKICLLVRLGGWMCAVHTPNSVPYHRTSETFYSTLNSVP